MKSVLGRPTDAGLYEKEETFNGKPIKIFMKDDTLNLNKKDCLTLKHNDTVLLERTFEESCTIKSYGVFEIMDELREFHAIGALFILEDKETKK